MTNGTCDLLCKVVLTVVLCGIIGSEREIRNKGAGLRTHILVGLGSALISLTSFYIFDIYKDAAFVDPSRIISCIVTGVGFICAGTIIRGGQQIIGLTTAASLWVVSGIGIAVAAGHYSGAITVAVVVFLVLIGLRSFEGVLARKFNNRGDHYKI